MDLFADSILARARGQEVPEGGYPGEEIRQRAARLLAEHPDLLDLSPEQARRVARERGLELQSATNKETLERFKVEFDVWFSEQGLHSSGAVEQAVQRLREQGHVYDAEGAVWLRTTDFGDDRDRVLVRANGVPTYFASDAAYYLSKKDRGFAEKIYLLGADHHGYVGRLKAIVACAGDDPQTNIEVLIGRLVTIAGARMGKRRGNAVYLSDLLDWIGTDPLRYSLARYPADSPLDLDGEELRRRSNDNPVFYVQYAHARTCNVTRLATEDGVHRDDGFDPALLTDPTEAVLLAALGDFSRVVAQAATFREPHRWLATGVAPAAYHKWYDACRVRPVDAEEEITDLHRTRLWVDDATGQVLANGLGLLGVTAPERM